MKKLLSLLLALTMLLTCASAMAEIPAGFHAEGMPIVDEPVTFSVLTMRWGDMGDSFTSNPFLVNLEKEANVKVDWQIVSSNDWGDQKPIMLAGGESVLPDVVLGFQTFNESDIINNVEYFLPLEDLIEQYMPNLTKAFEEMPALKAISTSADGHIYSLPSRMPKRPVACNVPVINMKWLENLGLEVPTTVDELVAVLPESFPLEGDVLPVERFDESQFLMPSQGADTYIRPIFAASPRKIGPHIITTNLDDESIVSMVEHGLGVSLLSRLVVKGLNYQVKIVPISPKYFRSLGIIVSEKRMHDKNIRRLINCSQSIITAKYGSPDL